MSGEQNHVSEYEWVHGKALDNFQSLDEVRDRINEIAKQFDIPTYYVRGTTEITIFDDGMFGNAMDFYVPKWCMKTK